MFIIVLGQHVSILVESSSGPSKKTDPYLKCLKCAVGYKCDSDYTNAHKFFRRISIAV